MDEDATTSELIKRGYTLHVSDNSGTCRGCHRWVVAGSSQGFVVSPKGTVYHISCAARREKLK